jgi:hypothetical protein
MLLEEAVFAAVEMRLRTPYLADALRNLHGVKPYPSRRHAGAPKDVRAQSRIETVER